MSQVNESFFLKSGKKWFEHKIRSPFVRNYDELILNLRAILGKEEQENKYFHVKEGGYGSHVVLAFENMSITIQRREVVAWIT